LKHADIYFAVVSLDTIGERIDPRADQKSLKWRGICLRTARSGFVFRSSALWALRSLATLCYAGLAFASSCEDLANLKLPDTTIETAQTIPAGDYTTADKVT
jgi:hypothetical protein